jgi:hypothetical protein
VAYISLPLIMKALTSEAAMKWNLEHGLETKRCGDPYFTDNQTKGVIRLGIPKEPHRMSYMILSLLDVQVDELDEVGGVEHLLWMRSWEMWPQLPTSIGLEFFNGLRKGYGIEEPLVEKPAILFSGTEMTRLISCALAPLVFGWDCYIIPCTAEYFVRISHDRFVDVSAKNEAVRLRLMVELQSWGPELIS